MFMTYPPVNFYLCVLLCPSSPRIGFADVA